MSKKIIQQLKALKTQKEYVFDVLRTNCKAISLSFFLCISLLKLLMRKQCQLNYMIIQIHFPCVVGITQ